MCGRELDAGESGEFEVEPLRGSWRLRIDH